VTVSSMAAFGMAALITERGRRRMPSGGETRSRRTFRVLTHAPTESFDPFKPGLGAVRKSKTLKTPPCLVHLSGQRVRDAGTVGRPHLLSWSILQLPSDGGYIRNPSGALHVVGRTEATRSQASGAPALVSC